VVAVGERPEPPVDERDDLVAQEVVIAARAGRVQELASPE
jgi:hypothetical protein